MKQKEKIIILFTLLGVLVVFGATTFAVNEARAKNAKAITKAAILGLASAKDDTEKKAILVESARAYQKNQPIKLVFSFTKASDQRLSRQDCEGIAQMVADIIEDCDDCFLYISGELNIEDNMGKYEIIEGIAGLIKLFFDRGCAGYYDIM